MTQVRILFLSANPADTGRIALGSELHEIDGRIRVSDGRDRIVLLNAAETRIDEFARTLQLHKPHVVHFSGHGAADGSILLADENDRAAAAGPDAVTDVFAALARDLGIRCVVLNACFSATLADALRAHVDCVIGAPGAVPDRVAIAFAGGFYESIGFGRDLAAAYQLALAQVRLLDLDTAVLPRMVCRDGVRPEELRLLDDAPTDARTDAPTDVARPPVTQRVVVTSAQRGLRAETRPGSFIWDGDHALTIDEKRALRDALTSAFPREPQLAIVLQDTLDTSLDMVVAPGTYLERIAGLLNWIDAEGRTREFLLGARQKNPGNPKLRAFEAAFSAARQSDEAPVVTPVANPLSPLLRIEVSRALTAIPALASVDARDRLVESIARASTFNRDRTSARADFELLLDALTADELAGVIERAVPLAAHDDALARRLGELASSVGRDFRAVAPSALPTGATPRFEQLLFAGVDARLPRSFLARALEAGRSTCRLAVPRLFGGLHDGAHAYGTAWILAPGLLITNDHVIDARDRAFEGRATPADYRAQAEGAVAWFDYYEAGGPRVEVVGASLVAQSESLDYAIVRLAAPPADRAALTITRVQPTLRPSDRLNIVQHPATGSPPAGGPQRYAIRNNFFASVDAAGVRIQYLTDTEPGASGSPVLDDQWRVVALHHASVPVAPHEAASPDAPAPDVARYHNEGTAMRAILEDLRAREPAVYAEIAAAQAWAG